MATISDYLLELDRQRDQLAANLTTMGVPSTADEKLNTLVPKVLQISQTGGSINESILLDSSGSTSKNDTLTTYGSSVYVYESADSVILSLSDVVEKWGGIDSTNNYLGDESSLYGICVSNWTSTECNTGILFANPLALNVGKVLITVNAFVNNWMNETLHIRLIAAEDLESTKAKILANDFAYTSTFVFAGNTSLRDHIISMGEVTAGTYYLYIDGTAKSDNSNFTYNKVVCLNY